MKQTWPWNAFARIVPIFRGSASTSLVDCSNEVLMRVNIDVTQFKCRTSTFSSMLERNMPRTRRIATVAIARPTVPDGQVALILVNSLTERGSMHSHGATQDGSPSLVGLEKRSASSWIYCSASSRQWE